MIFLAIISKVRSAGRLTAARAVSKATPTRRVVSGSKFWPFKKGLMVTRASLSRQAEPKLANFTLSAVKPKSEARMPKKRPDKQQNQEEPPLSLGRGMPQPPPVDDEAFSRRAGEIIGNSNTSLQKARDAGNKRPRRSG